MQSAAQALCFSCTGTVQSHWALETTAPEPLGARNHCSGAETAAPEPLGVRNRCFEATVRSKPLLQSHWALETAALKPLGARKHCTIALEATWALELASKPLCTRRHCSSLLRNHCALERTVRTHCSKPQFKKPGSVSLRSDTLNSVSLHSENGYSRVHSSIYIYIYIYIYPPAP